MHLRPIKATYPRLAKISSIETFLKTVKEDYHSYLEKDCFLQHESAAICIYQIREKEETYVGIVSGVDIRDFLDGKIKAHENTIEEKENKQIQLMLNRQASVKPILLSYPANTQINEWIQSITEQRPPDFDWKINDGNASHRFWYVIEKENIRVIQRLFKEHVGSTYIADGHHRTTAATKLFEKCADSLESNPYREILCAFFSSTELRVFDFKRVIDLQDAEQHHQLLDRLSSICSIDRLVEASLPINRHFLTMYYKRGWYQLQWRKEVLDHSTSQFDAVLLNDYIFKDIFGILDVKTDHRIQYLDGKTSLIDFMKRSDALKFGVAFNVYPMEIREIFENTDRGVTLPPKSTWFEPRLKNGLIVLKHLKELNS